MPNPLDRARLGRVLTAAALAALVADRVRSRARFAARESTVRAMAEEHAALHNVAALVARGADLDALCTKVAGRALSLVKARGRDACLVYHPPLSAA